MCARRREDTGMSHDSPFRVKLVIVTAFQPELSGWVHRVPLGETIAFPEGTISGASLYLNRSLGVLGISTGMGPSRAAVSLMALASVPSIDLRSSYWLVAGIAGVDPQWGSIGSVFVARYLVGLGRDYDVDGIGFVPHGRDTPSHAPPYVDPATAAQHGAFHALDPQIADWAYAAASTAHLPDSPRLQQARAGYKLSAEAPARAPPSVRHGDSITGETFWAGRTLTSYARNATIFYSGGLARFAVSQMEGELHAKRRDAACERPLSLTTRVHDDIPIACCRPCLCAGNQRPLPRRARQRVAAHRAALRVRLYI